MKTSLHRRFHSALIILIVSSACRASLSFAQSPFLEVDSTPYDRQMARVEPTFAAPLGYAFEDMSIELVNEWMIELRAMPYRYSREWHTPAEVEKAKAADCKGKAITLYDRMQLNGVANIRFIIGKRRAVDLVTHAWIEWETHGMIYILDPTFNWIAALKTPDRSKYVGFYGYEGTHKYLIGDPMFVSRNMGTRVPIAPSQGTVTRPIRSVSKFRNDQTNASEISFELRMMANRTGL